MTGNTVNTPEYRKARSIAKELRRVLVLWLLLVPAVACSPATPPEVNSSDRYGVREIVTGLGVPWGIAFIAESEMLITERQGAIKRHNLESGQTADISGAPEVVAAGQGGLLDIALSPDYRSDGWIYLTYSKPVDGGAATALARARLQENSLVDVEELFVSNHHSDSGLHFGSRIAFDGDGHLFMSLGERGERSTAQELGIHSGSIIRLNLDGSVPADNPFVDTAGAQPEIWSFGHRNPQGLAYDSANDRLWTIEHGPRGGDEINLVEPGKNYGWPVISYGKEYMAPVMVGEGTHKEGMEQPVKYYVPSIAPAGLIYYTGERYPRLDNSLLAGALKLTHLNQVSLDEAGTPTEEYRYLERLGERIRDVVVGPDGGIYLSTDSGKILLLQQQ